MAKSSLNTVVDCIRARYRNEDWFVSVSAEAGAARLTVRQDCPIRAHRDVLETRVAVHVLEPSPEEKPRTGPRAPRFKPKPKGARPPAKKEKVQRQQKARESVLAIRQQRSQGKLVDIAEELRRRMPPTESSRAMCEALALLLRRKHGMTAEVRPLDFGFTVHSVLELADGRVLDPTADQFRDLGAGLPDVYLGPMPEAYERWMGLPNDAVG